MSDFRQMGRDCCSNQPHRTSEKAVELIEIEISNSKLSVIDKKEIHMQPNRLIRSTGVTSSSLVVNLKIKAVTFFMAAALVTVCGFGDQST